VKFLVAYGARPAHLFGLWGFGAGSLGVGILAYLSWIKLFQDEAIWGRPLLLLGVLLCLTGLILVSVGLLAELLVRIYHESQGKPTYVVKELHRGDEPGAAPAVRGRFS
jgi:hypothetical protein